MNTDYFLFSEHVAFKKSMQKKKKSKSLHIAIFCFLMALHTVMLAWLVN